MIVIPIILVVIILYLVTFFNKLKTAQINIGASIQEIGNQLKRQADLIPNLIESAKGYLKHEKDIFTQLTDARKSIDQAVASNDPKKIKESQDLVNKVLGSLKVIVESNPELKSADVITDLMNELRDTADKLMYSRRTLIDLSADYNTAISTIPGIWIAPMLGFKEEKGLSTPKDGKFLEVDESETQTPKVNL